MDIRYSTGKEPFKTMTTEELRKEFLISNIFVKNDVSAVYSHIDRIVTLGAMPVDKKVKLDKNIDLQNVCCNLRKILSELSVIVKKAESLV